jgi:hypothetical protein
VGASVRFVIASHGRHYAVWIFEAACKPRCSISTSRMRNF